MDKQTLISTVMDSWSKMGITAARGQGTDLSIDTELVDAGWSTGKKTLRYEASVLFDESSQTVFMHEKTIETGGGLSFGGQSETSFQSGKTLFRKVKSVQYGPEGKVLEYELDLGAIPKTVKQAAQEAGWKFKTVLRKKNARWANESGDAEEPAQAATPKGASEAATPLRVTVGAPAAPAPGDPETTGRTGSSVWSRLAVIGLSLIAALSALLLIGAKASAGGWISLIIIAVGTFLLLRTVRRKGCLLQGVILAPAALLLLIALMASMPEGGYSTAALHNAVMTTAVNESGQALDTVTAFPSDAPQLAVSAELRHAPDGTAVRFVWYYLTDQQREITSFTMNNTDRGSDVYVFSTLNNQGNSWPAGDYRVDLFVDQREKPDLSIPFKVE